MNKQIPQKRHGIKYVGQYKPIEPYPLAGSLVICPENRMAFPMGPGGEMYLNVSYLVGQNEALNDTLETVYRNWLVFDSFVLDDQYPIFFYNDCRSGNLETVPFGIDNKKDAITLDYKQIDYANMARFPFLVSSPHECLSAISYSELYDCYQRLPDSTKDMIEWYVSAPYQPFIRHHSFSNIPYSRIIHMVILLEALIGKKPNCSSTLPSCATCGYKPQPHPMMRRQEWLQTYLGSKITDDKIVEEYISIIESGRALRNKNVHVPTFDRSFPKEIPSGHTHTYGIDRAVQEYKADSYALGSLSVSIKKVARYILLNAAFGISHFPRLTPLKVTCVSSNAGVEQ